MFHVNAIVTIGCNLFPATIQFVNLQVELALDRRCGDGMLLPASLYSLAQRQWLEIPAHLPVPWDMQRSVQNTLVELGIDCELDWRTDDGLVPIDIMTFFRHGHQVAILVDGTDRYTSSEPHSLLQVARLHRQMLHHRCVGYISISSHEWEKLDTKAAKAEWLAAALKHFMSGGL